MPSVTYIGNTVSSRVKISSDGYLVVLRVWLQKVNAVVCLDLVSGKGQASRRTARMNRRFFERV